MNARFGKKTVYVAMSGGVDSSVASALLKRKGFNVVGVFMKPWQPENNPELCLWKEDRQDALRVASSLEIPLLTWDFSKEYKKHVTEYMINEYRAGRTPNPDVMCNKEIKFGLFLDKALKSGADLIATGHYAVVGNRKNSKNKLEYFIKEGKDKNKDQSYFLWTLSQKQLKHCLFPIGTYTKPQVRELALKFNLPTAEKKDSQGVCFIGELNMHEFLKNYIPPQKGDILNSESKKVGTHDGAGYYTVGQRHGLNILDGKGPYFVVGKDIKKNLIFVGPESELSSNSAWLEKISWTILPPKLPAKFKIRFRYRAKPKEAILRKDGQVQLVDKERAITSGQSAVFYRGQEMLGGGIVK